MSRNDDDFLADRFGEFNRSLLEEQIQEHDQHKNNFHFDEHHIVRQLYFAGKIPQKVSSILEKLFVAILEFSAKQGLFLRDQNHQVRFLDIASYEQETNRPIPASISLPASLLQFNPISRVYTVTIILPNQIQTNEEVINITRTLFAKFMGDIYLNEYILSLPFYQSANRNYDDVISVSIPDQLEAIRSNDFSSSMFQDCCKAYAKQYQMNYKKHRASIQREITKEWMQQWEKQTLAPETTATIDQIFQDFLEEFRLHPENALLRHINQIEQLNAQLHFILPHEMKAYNLFEGKSQVQYIQAATNKIEEILAKIGFIEEIIVRLAERVDPEELVGILEQVYIQMKQLKREGKVKIFLIPNVEVGPQLKQQEQKFPLYLIKLLPKTLPVQEWSKETKSLQKKYKNSIYQKIFEALIYLKHWLVARLERKEELFLESEEHKKLQQLSYNFKFREPTLHELKTTLGITHDYSDVLKLSHKQTSFPLQSFKKAWSYVSSSILIHLYYEHMNELGSSPRKFNSKQYMQAIEQYVFHQIDRNVDFARLIALLLFIYKEKKGEGLKYLLYLLQNPQASLQYAFNQVMLPFPESMSLEDKRNECIKRLEQYRDYLIEVYEERIATDILPGRDY